MLLQAHIARNEEDVFAQERRGTRVRQAGGRAGSWRAAGWRAGSLTGANLVQGNDKLHADFGFVQIKPQ